MESGLRCAAVVHKGHGKWAKVQQWSIRDMESGLRCAAVVHKGHGKWVKVCSSGP